MKNLGNDNNIFTEEKLKATIQIFFVSIVKYCKLQQKLNEGCKVLLEGKGIPSSMLALNNKIDKIFCVINNCLKYIKAFKIMGSHSCA